MVQGMILIENDIKNFVYIYLKVIVLKPGIKYVKATLGYAINFLPSVSMKGQGSIISESYYFAIIEL